MAKDGRPTTVNPQPFTKETSERQNRGGNIPVTGERHNQPKATTIPAEKRFAGAEDTSLANSPGRVNEDVNGSK